MDLTGHDPVDITVGMREFESLWRLPKLPFTERFGRYRRDAGLVADQELVMSELTGALRLRYQIEPSILYREGTYAYRTTSSDKASNSTLEFVQFLDSVAGERRFRSIVDVGGNDLTLARLLGSRAESVAVIDPVCEAIDGEVVDDIAVHGRKIEDVEMATECALPDLVVCRHTLEHIGSPEVVVAQLFEQSADDCLFVFEVPDVTSLLESLRFDAIFHQHYNYFSVATLSNLIVSCGGRVVAHEVNHRGSCGGSLMIAFEKGDDPEGLRHVDCEQVATMFRRRLRLFTAQMEAISGIIRELPRPVYGYGAGLMLATYSYHLDTDFSNLDCILDDDPSKDGLTYENVPVTVRCAEYVKPEPDSSYVITSLENIRALQQRISGLQARRCVSPPIG